MSSILRQHTAVWVLRLSYVKKVRTTGRETFQLPGFYKVGDATGNDMDRLMDQATVRPVRRH
jgi:hypothetical protein